MAAQMKSIAYGLGKAKDQENGQSYGSNVGPRFFCGVNFLGLVALDETMISITTTMIKVNAQMPKPWNVDEILDLQRGEVQH